MEHVEAASVSNERDESAMVSKQGGDSDFPSADTSFVETIGPAEWQVDAPDWLREMQHKLGRPLRILHIGNIANNGYLNAKIMREVGVEADVLCYDYYHVMGTPEWEDAEYTGDIGDSFFPDWWRANLHGFKRPDWFVQGPKEMCLEYLSEKFRGNEDRAEFLRSRLELETHYFAYRCSPRWARPKKLAEYPGWLRRHFDFGIFLLIFVTREKSLAYGFFKRRLRNLSNAILPGWRGLSRALGFLVSVLMFPIVVLWTVVTFDIGSVRRAWAFWSWKCRQMLAPLFRSVQGAGSRLYRRLFGRSFSEVYGGTILEVLHRKPEALWAAKEDTRSDGLMERLSHYWEGTKAGDADGLVPDDQTQENIAAKPRMTPVETWQQLFEVVREIEAMTGRGRGWVERHKSNNPDTSAGKLQEDFLLAHALRSGWKETLAQYDLVQCYATDSILAMACGNAPFFAYEHGTLRQIPFEDSPVGRLTRTAYQNARAAFVTNLDNLPRCSKLGIEERRTVSLPHALDDKKLLSFRRAHSNIKPSPSAPPEFFCPSRQDWVVEDLNYSKGNDIFFDAIKILRDEGHELGVTLVAWGRDLEASRVRLEELGITDVVTWVAPMKKAELWKRYFASHAVVDQFVIPAFGSVTFEALTFGLRTITRIDQALATEFFGEAPPILSAATPQEVAAQMRKVIEDPEDVAGLGRETYEWARKYHSSQSILDLQLDAYKETLEGILDGCQNL